jgi:hypothetical protein
MSAAEIAANNRAFENAIETRKSLIGFMKVTRAFVQSLFLTGLNSADVGNQLNLFGEGLASAIMQNRSGADIVSRANNAAPLCGPVPQISEPACRSTRSGTRSRARSLSSKA